MSDCAYFLDEDGKKGEGVWTGFCVGEYVSTGLHLDTVIQFVCP